MLKGLALAAAIILAPVAATAGPFKSAIPYKTISPEAQIAAMGPGINAGAGWDPYWTGKTDAFALSDLQTIRDAGFRTVRVPISAFKHLNGDGQLNLLMLKRLDAIVAEALRLDLSLIIDVHENRGCARDVDACGVMLPKVWRALSEHYRDAPSQVMFELLNEPNGKVDAVWNDWVPGLISTIRETNPTRNIIVGPVWWNSLHHLDKLKLPADDRHLIVTFHYYEPNVFTHQGADWVDAESAKARNVRWTGTAEELAKLNADFDKAAAWSKANNRPLFLGEYGTYGKVNTNMEDRAAWTQAVSRAADARGFGRAFWYFTEGGPEGFTAFDRTKKEWIGPVRDALIYAK